MAAKPTPRPLAKSSAPTALIDAPASHAGRPIETHGVEELALEATKQHVIKMGTSRQEAVPAVQDNFFIPVAVRICMKARQPSTNLFAWLQKGTPVRYIEGDERQPSRIAILVVQSR